jgi:REP element-mobilizing transposase RayT
MSRPLRLHIPGTLYHVMSRGNDKQCIFRDDTDHRSILDGLADALARFDVRCAGYCFMWNHYHLLLRAGALPISRMMHQLNSGYCGEFNRRHHRVGHVLQGRFKAPLVEDGAAARRVLRYLALNPVVAGYIANPEEYAWSSYRAAMGLAEPPAFLALDEVWSIFRASDAGTGRMRLAEFVRAGMQEDFPDPLLVGSDRLKRLVAPLLKPHQTIRDHVRAERHAARPSLGTLFEGCINQPALDEAARRAFVEHAYTLAEISAVVSRDPSVVCRWVQRAKRSGRGLASSPEDTRATNKI